MSQPEMKTKTTIPVADGKRVMICVRLSPKTIALLADERIRSGQSTGRIIDIIVQDHYSSESPEENSDFFVFNS